MLLLKGVSCTLSSPLPPCLSVAGRAWFLIGRKVGRFRRGAWPLVGEVSAGRGYGGGVEVVMVEDPPVEVVVGDGLGSLCCFANSPSTWGQKYHHMRPQTQDLITAHLPYRNLTVGDTNSRPQHTSNTSCHTKGK